MFTLGVDTPWAIDGVKQVGLPIPLGNHLKIQTLGALVLTVHQSRSIVYIARSIPQRCWAT